MSAIQDLELPSIMAALSSRRPIFHSEADFQHELAFLIHSQEISLQVRLEVPQSFGITLDLLLRDPANEETFAIELKYKSSLWNGEIAGEPYRLKNHGADDLGGYDVLKDLQRVETLVAAGATRGAVIFVTNEPLYWRPRQIGSRITNAHEFRIHEGLEIGGARAWGSNTGGTSKGRESPINLTNSYSTRWTNYSDVGGTRGTFRKLVLETSLNRESPKA